MVRARGHAEGIPCASLQGRDAGAARPDVRGVLGDPHRAEPVGTRSPGEDATRGESQTGIDDA